MGANRDKFEWLIGLALVMGLGVTIWTLVTYQPTAKELSETLREQDSWARRQSRLISNPEREVRRLLRRGEEEQAGQFAREWGRNDSANVEARFWRAYLLSRTTDTERLGRVARSGLGLASAEVMAKPGNHWSWYYKGWFHRLLGQEDEALGAFRTLQEVFAEQSDRMPPDQWLYNAACFTVLEGRTEEGLALLGRAIEAGWSDLAWARVDPDFELVRNDPRFMELVQMGPTPDRAGAADMQGNPGEPGTGTARTGVESPRPPQ